MQKKKSGGGEGSSQGVCVNEELKGGAGPGVRVVVLKLL